MMFYLGVFKYATRGVNSVDSTRIVVADSIGVYTSLFLTVSQGNTAVSNPIYHLNPSHRVL